MKNYLYILILLFVSLNLCAQFSKADYDPILAEKKIKEENANAYAKANCPPPMLVCLWSLMM